MLGVMRLSSALAVTIGLGSYGCTPSTDEKKTVDARSNEHEDDPSHEKAAPPEKDEPVSNSDAADDAALKAGPAKDLAAATNRFGFDLYGSLAGDPGNIVMSPASIELALLMTWAGAKDDTAAQMAKVMHVGELGESAHASAGQMLRAWNDPGRQTYELAVVNKIFVEQTTPLEEPFVELTKREYGAAYEPLDFRVQFEASRKHINAYVAEQTKDRIQDLLPDGSLDELTRMVLTNAVYFLGQWNQRFDEKATRDAAFFVSGKTEAQVPTMHQTENFGLARPQGLAVLEMPYVGQELSMVVFLPDAREGLADVEKRLPSEYDRWVDALAPQKVEVAFPRFKIEMSDSIALKKQLQALGMPVAFTDDANFEAMSNPADAAEQLKISDVYHKAFVEVNEEGTEAAAATAVVMVARGAAPQNERFVADHPFLFVIRDLRNGTILFLGRVEDPRS